MIIYLGLNGALICNVNDDPSVIRSPPTSSLNFNRTNLPVLESPRRFERIVPPLGFWNTYGVSKFVFFFLFYLINIISFVLSSGYRTLETRISSISYI
jgi:hypothetical protein